MSEIMQRLARVQNISKEYLSLTPPAPKSVKIELTSRCNYRCAYCALTYRPKQENSTMDWALFKRLAKEMRENGVEEIGLFYIGEPFTDPDYLLRAIKRCKELGYPYVFLTSNASLAKPDEVQSCMDAGLDSLKWSVNASDSGQFEKMMGVNPIMFELAKKNIRRAFEIRNDYGYRTKLYASSIKYSDEQMKQAEPFLSEFIIPYVDKHYWLPLYTMAGTAKDKEQELGFMPVAGNPGSVEQPVAPIPCWTVFTAGHILVDGRMTACCMDGLGKWVVGDLKTQSFMDAWHSPDFQELRKAHINKDIRGTKCAKCALVG